jgi:hypothetical protein
LNNYMKFLEYLKYLSMWNSIVLPWNKTNSKLSCSCIQFKQEWNHRTHLTQDAVSNNRQIWYIIPSFANAHKDMTGQKKAFSSERLGLATQSLLSSLGRHGCQIGWTELYWDPLRDDRWNLSLWAWRWTAGDTWYAIRQAGAHGAFGPGLYSGDVTAAGGFPPPHPSLLLLLV